MENSRNKPHGSLFSLPVPSQRIRGSTMIEDDTLSSWQGQLLVAATDPDLRCLVSSALRSAGHEVVEAASGVALFDILVGSLDSAGVEGRFDLVLSDVRLFEWPGFDALASLGENPSFPPLIAIASANDDELHQRAKQAHAAAVFDKPLDIVGLCSFVQFYVQFHTR